MGIKQYFATLGLAATTVFSGQAAEVKEKAPNDEAAHVKTILQTASLKTADVIANQQEAAKHILFPSFLPVTSDGQFDQDISRQWIKDFDAAQNIPYIRNYIRDVKHGISVDKAYGTLAKQMARGDQAKEEQLLQMFPLVQKAVQDVDGKTTKTTNCFHIASALFAISALWLLSKSQKEGSSATMMAAVASVIVGTALAATPSGIAHLTEPGMLENCLFQEHKALYDTYVKQQMTSNQDLMIIMDSGAKPVDALYKVPNHKSGSGR